MSENKYGGLQHAGLVLAALVTIGLVWLALQPKEPVVDREAAEARESALAKAEAERQAEEHAVEEAERELRAQVALPKNRPLRVSFLGDSITYGNYVTSPDLQFTARVGDWLDQKAPKGAVTSVEAKRGFTATQALQFFEIPVQQDLVVVMLGTNDAGRDEADKFAVSFPDLVRRIHQASPGAQVVCVQPYAPESLVTDINKVIDATCSDEDSEAVAAGISDIARDPDMRAHQGSQYQSGIVPDGGHPNDAGHAAIARTVQGAIELV